MSDPQAPKRRPWLLQYTRGLIVDQHLRRLTMFYVVIAAMLMFFAGDWVVPEWRGHLMRFALYWLACGWLTILAALLAIYDLILLRVHHRVLERQLREHMLGKDGKDEGRKP